MVVVEVDVAAAVADDADVEVLLVDEHPVNRTAAAAIPAAVSAVQ